MRRDLVYLTVLFWYVCKHFFSQLQHLFPVVTQMLSGRWGSELFAHLQESTNTGVFFLQIKILLWNQPNISEVKIFATVSEMSNVQKEKKKILCALTLVPLHFPVPNIHPVTTSFKPIHAACNGSLTRWRVSKLRDFRCFLFAGHVKNVPL